jgi:aspartokinase
MANVAHLVAKIIRQQPHLEDFIERDLVSFHRLARYLLPLIKAETNEDVNEGAVVMAISRLREKMVERRGEQIMQPSWEKIEISMRSGVVEIDVPRTEGTHEKVDGLRKMVENPQEDFFNVVQGQYEMTIIASKKYKDGFLKALKGEKILHIEDELSLIYLRFPNDVYYTPGFYERTLSELSWQNINVFELVSTLNELVIVVKEKDASRTYEVLRQAFKGGKR